MYDQGLPSSVLAGNSQFLHACVQHTPSPNHILILSDYSRDPKHYVIAGGGALCTHVHTYVHVHVHIRVRSRMLLCPNLHSLLDKWLLKDLHSTGAVGRILVQHPEKIQGIGMGRQDHALVNQSIGKGSSRLRALRVLLDIRVCMLAHSPQEECLELWVEVIG